YSGMECGSDFGSGFRAGYAGMATYGNGTVPALPPRTYWSPWYQSQYGQQQTQAWFDGYSHGVLAAGKDGVNPYSRITTTAKPGGRRPNSTGNHKVVNPPPPAPPAESTPKDEDVPSDVPSYDDQPATGIPALPPPEEISPPGDDSFPPNDQ